MTALVIELTPGPNMGYLTVITISRGRRAGLATVGGIALGLLLIGLAAAFGVAQVIQRMPLIYEILRFGGVAYLLWLAYDGWRDADKPLIADVAESEPATALLPLFRQGLITNLLNPKAALFYLATLPEFITATPQNPALPQALLLTAIYVLIATTVHLGIVGLGGQARIWLHSGRSVKSLQKGMAVLLALIALWLGWSTAHC